MSMLDAAYRFELGYRLLFLVKPPTAGEFAFLKRVAESSEPVATLKIRMDQDRRFVQRNNLLIFLIYLGAPTVAFGVSFKRSEWVGGLILIALIVAIGQALGFAVARKKRDYLLTRALLASMRSATLAKNTPPASTPRRVLASQVVGAARLTRKYRMYLNGLDARILRRTANDAGAAVRSMAHTALLGSASDLERLRWNLARGALRANAGYWTQLAELKEDVKPGDPSRDFSFIQATLLQLFVPLTILVVTALIKVVWHVNVG